MTTPRREQQHSRLNESHDRNCVDSKLPAEDPYKGFVIEGLTDSQTMSRAGSYLTLSSLLSLLATKIIKKTILLVVFVFILY
jgi:hypothetical protein